MKVLYYLLPLFAIAVVSCTNSKNDSDGAAEGGKSSSVAVSQMAEIDIQKDYPKKKLLLEEIADVEYIPLETTDSVLLGGSLEESFSGDMVVLADRKDGTVSFFNRQGKFLRSFNHKGQGDKEYTAVRATCVDFEREEVFIYDYPLRYRIMVYSFDGEFKRELKLESPRRWVSDMRLYSYDETHLVSYDRYYANYKDPSDEKFNKYPYFLIDKQSGKISSLPLKIDKRITNEISWSDKDGFSGVFAVGIGNWMKADKGVYISDFALDTIYHCTGDNITPKAVRKNNPDKSRNFSALCFESNRYSFFDIVKIRIDNVKETIIVDDGKLLLFDKRDGTMYEVEGLSMNDFAEDKYSPDISSSFYEDVPEGYYFELFDSERLNRLLERGILKGKIKEIAENMDEDANPVMMLVKFKE